MVSNAQAFLDLARACREGIRERFGKATAKPPALAQSTAIVKSATLTAALTAALAATFAEAALAGTFAEAALAGTFPAATASIAGACYRNVRLTEP